MSVNATKAKLQLRSLPEITAHEMSADSIVDDIRVIQLNSIIKAGGQYVVSCLLCVVASHRHWRELFDACATSRLGRTHQRKQFGWHPTRAVKLALHLVALWMDCSQSSNAGNNTAFGFDI